MHLRHRFGSWARVLMGRRKWRLRRRIRHQERSVKLNCICYEQLTKPGDHAGGYWKRVGVYQEDREDQAVKALLFLGGHAVCRSTSVNNLCTVGITDSFNLEMLVRGFDTHLVRPPQSRWYLDDGLRLQQRVESPGLGIFIYLKCAIEGSRESANHILRSTYDTHALAQGTIYSSFTECI